MDDLISRQAAIEKINAGFLTEDSDVECVEECNAMLDFAISEIKKLPSAQTEIIRCKDCKHQKKVFHEDKRRKDGGYYIFGCELVDGYSPVCFDDEFCSRAERKTDE